MALRNLMLSALLAHSSPHLPEVHAFGLGLDVNFEALGLG